MELGTYSQTVIINPTVREFTVTQKPSCIPNTRFSLVLRDIIFPKEKCIVLYNYRATNKTY
jgi:hypothetical protein